MGAPSQKTPEGAPPRRVVVKLGTEQLEGPKVAAVCKRVAELRKQGVEVIIVSSGAIGLGMKALGLSRKPKDLDKKQACAAIGQNRLMGLWQDGFEAHSLTVAQVLLTHDDLRIRSRYRAVQDTLRRIIEYGAIPIINENDTVSAAEIQFGDNDTLSAMVASLVKADHLYLISTAPGLIDYKGTGKVVPVVEKVTPEVAAMARGTSSELATGGMVSKIAAAKIATSAGSSMIITSSLALEESAAGTRFLPSREPQEARKIWLAYFQRPKGTIRVDARAAVALRQEGRSLLAVGVTGAEGEFAANDPVNIAGPDGAVIARGASSLSRAEVQQAAGKRGVEIIHRDDMALL